MVPNSIITSGNQKKITPKLCPHFNFFVPKAELDLSFFKQLSGLVSVHIFDSKPFDEKVKGQ